jgi:hypothetical protein
MHSKGDDASYLEFIVLLNPVRRHLSVGPSQSRFPASSRQLFQGIISSPRHEEALTLAKRRFIEYQTVWNDLNLISDSSLHERTTHIILGESRFHVVKNAPNEYGSGIVILEWTPDLHLLLENTKKSKVKALKDIYAMSGKVTTLTP